MRPLSPPPGLLRVLGQRAGNVRDEDANLVGVLAASLQALRRLIEPLEQKRHLGFQGRRIRDRRQSDDRVRLR